MFSAEVKNYTTTGQVSRDCVKPARNTPEELSISKLSEVKKNWIEQSEKKTIEEIYAKAVGLQPKDLHDYHGKNYENAADNIQKMELAIIQGLLFNEFFRTAVCIEILDDTNSDFSRWGAKLVLEAATIAAFVEVNPDALIVIPSVHSRRQKKTNFYVVKRGVISPIIIQKSKNDQYWVYVEDTSTNAVVFPGSPQFKGGINKTLRGDKYDICRKENSHPENGQPLIVSVPWDSVIMSRDTIGLAVPAAIRE